MGKIAWMIAFLVSLHSLQVIANPSTQFIEDNQSHFIDNMVNQKEIPVHQWIEGYNACSQPIEKLFKQVDSYSDAFLKRDYAAAEHVFIKIHEALNRENSCTETLWSSYMVMAMMLGTQSQKDYINQQTYRNEQAILSVVLANKGKLKVLKPALRKELMDLNGAPIWVEKSKDKFVVNGFYDCKNSTVYLSDDLRPFDMAAALNHELDHLYRDKFYKFDNLGWSAFEDKLHFRSYLAFDEVLATVRGGFFQRRMLRFNEKPGNYHVAAENDFKFYNENGPLTAMVEKFDADTSFKLLKHNSAGQFLYSVSSEGGYEKELQELLEIVTTGYFGKPSEDLGLFTNAFSMITSLFGQTSINDAYIESHFYYLSHAIEHRPDPYGHLFETYNQWADLVDHPTQLCEKVIETQNQGELDDYIGTQMAAGGHGGNEGIRPCLKIHF